MHALLTTSALIVALAMPGAAWAQAQPVEPVAPEVQPEMPAQGVAELQQAQRRLALALERLEQGQLQPPDAGSRQQLRQEAQAALVQAQQAIGLAPQDRQEALELSVSQAQQALQAQNDAAAVQTMTELNRELQAVSGLPQFTEGEQATLPVPPPAAAGARQQPAATAAAQQQPATGTAAVQQPVPPGARPLAGVQGIDVVGRDVHLTTGEQIGTVDDVLVTPAGDARLVISLGGFLGLGERQISVPVDQAFLDAQDNLVVAFTAEQIQSLPPYDTEPGYAPIGPDRHIGGVPPGGG